MILSGRSIRAYIDAGSIVVDPHPRDEHIGPNSVDLHLGPELKVYDLAHREALDASDPPPLVDAYRNSDGGWTLYPGQLYLGSTLERAGTVPGSGLVPHLDGRSSLARLGIWAHLAAGRGDVGFVGHWTVELVAVHKVRIQPGMRAFQMSFHQCMPGSSYARDYAGRTEPVGSRGVKP